MMEVMKPIIPIEVAVVETVEPGPEGRGTGVPPELGVNHHTSSWKIF
jgi:hypothetical protein